MEHSNGEIVILTTVADPDHAEVFARGLIERKLAACVTCLPNATSYYHWEGEGITRDPEIVVLIKTHRQLLPALEHYFDDEHPYELPEFLIFEIAALSAPYREWMMRELYTK